MWKYKVFIVPGNKHLMWKYKVFIVPGNKHLCGSIKFSLSLVINIICGSIQFSLSLVINILCGSIKFSLSLHLFTTGGVIAYKYNSFKRSKVKRLLLSNDEEIISQITHTKTILFDQPYNRQSLVQITINNICNFVLLKCNPHLNQGQICTDNILNFASESQCHSVGKLTSCM